MEDQSLAKTRCEAPEQDVIVALVPVKDLWRAKQRLADLLSASERRELCLAMLWDVLAALKTARRLDGILVYSGDEDALAVAAELDIAAEREKRAEGQSQAVTAAIPLCRQRGATAVATIPVDTPLLQGDDVDALIGFHKALALPRPSAVMVSSADGTGTNCLLLTPPECLPPAFGPDSWSRHIAEAHRLGIASRHFILPRLALDIDTAADLSAFLRMAEEGRQTATRTYQYLLRTGIAGRCRVWVG